MLKNKKTRRDMPNVDIPQDDRVAIETMPLETLRDYRLYNEEARKINKKAHKLLYPVKQCPIALHPKRKITFNRNDQPTNALPVYLSNHLIHFDEMWYPGETYDAPECVISHLEKKGHPIWGWVDNADGSKETRVVNKKPRFAISTVYQEM